MAKVGSALPERKLGKLGSIRRCSAKTVGHLGFAGTTVPLALGLYDPGIAQCSGQRQWHPDTKACTVHLLPAVLFQFHLEDRWGIDMCKLGVISQERLKIDTKTN